MFDFLKCKKCDSMLSYSRRCTVDHYKAEYAAKGIKPSRVGLYDYLVYKCAGCGLEHRFTYKDLENMEREFITGIVNSQIKNGDQELLMSHTSSVVDCGLCSGIDGKGKCYADIYRNCKRRLRLGDKL